MAIENLLVKKQPPLIPITVPHDLVVLVMMNLGREEEGERSRLEEVVS